MRQIDKIIVHCTATPQGRNIKIGQIADWHIKGNGWKNIGYHYVVELDGTIKHGRPEEQIGAHARGHNAHSIGVCYVGGLDTHGNAADTRTPEQKAALINIITHLRQRYPKAIVIGHHDVNKTKECPCFDAAKEYALL